MTDEEKLNAASSYLRAVQVMGLLNQAIGKTGAVALVTKPKPMLISGQVRIELQPDSFAFLSSRISASLVGLTDDLLAKANALTNELATKNTAAPAAPTN